MLADEFDRVVSGKLAPDVHHAGDWLLGVIDFVYRALPFWRDDRDRRLETAEDLLTGQLCQFLNGAAQLTSLDSIVFQTEVADPEVRNRVLDIAALPLGCTIWIGDQHYKIYDPILPIECKRLPTPRRHGRDPREYLHTLIGQTGGVQRFRAGLYGSRSSVGALIAYVQQETSDHWHGVVNAWVLELERQNLDSWAASECLDAYSRDQRRRTARALSAHARRSSEGPITLHHLWVEM
ncbi:hypothetical protein C8J35_1313 [Rhizobium sp. PP-F2F-G38]|nr:hypothetical protein C8J37_1323 [Rhizobium sp. PP-WC-1G-195]PYE39927.1 hypothetical protein DFI02_1203 [Rhizobium sp. PP-F2F-G20b]PYE92078.1 hypothetical protein C8J35_1313 [Rhizobium sp. PP-F2F-G38]TCL89696.1 hypothetical protein C8J38_11166 [Rhizobium sp. PP-WC-2G-219]TCP74746.1 hypothetical protein C8J31_13810 [Rhizobium sp. PP-CC-2G-626]TCQ14829.1 hypothetical protein C8J33_12332 [Rhizobium sp. PP-CC-3G-465]